MAPRRPPSFFKVLLDPSAPHLPLPPDFVSRHLENKIPKDPIIRSATGGYIWRLKVKQIGESYCFANGWNNVVKDMQLGVKDFLVFRFVDQSTFKMLIYSPNGCEKKFPPKIKVEHDVVSEDVVDDDVDDDDAEEEDEDKENDDKEEEQIIEEEKEDCDDSDPFFKSIIRKTRVLRIPAEFAGSAGIDAEGTITLKNLDGKEWQLGLRLDKSYLVESYVLSAGWPKFRQSNDLCEGDECEFKFIRSEGKLCLTKITKKRKPARQPRPSGRIPATEVVKRKRGQLRQREQDGGVNVESEDHCVEVTKRPRGRPPQKKSGVTCKKLKT